MRALNSGRRYKPRRDSRQTGGYFLFLQETAAELEPAQRNRQEEQQAAAAKQQARRRPAQRR